MGLTRAPVQTVGEWLEGQALSVYNEMNDLMMNIIALKNARQPGPLNEDQQRLFRLALYDLDSFRNFLNRTENRTGSGSEHGVAISGRDETELLRFSFRWVVENLFNLSRPDS
jgi:hypothetical protein